MGNKGTTGERAFMIRLRQLSAAFLLAAVVMAVFSFIGIRGTRRNDTINEQLLMAFRASQDLRLAINRLEFQLSLARREVQESGFASPATIRNCQNLVPPIEEKFNVMSMEAGSLLDENAQYFEFVALQQHVALQMTVLELDSSDYTMARTLESVSSLRQLALALDTFLQQQVTKNLRSGNNLGMVSLALIGAVFLLLLLFTLPMMLTPKGVVAGDRRARSNVFYLESRRTQNHK